MWAAGGGGGGVIVVVRATFWVEIRLFISIPGVEGVRSGEGRGTGKAEVKRNKKAGG